MLSANDKLNELLNSTASTTKYEAIVDSMRRTATALVDSDANLKYDNVTALLDAAVDQLKSTVLIGVGVSQDTKLAVSIAGSDCSSNFKYRTSRNWIHLWFFDH